VRLWTVWTASDLGREGSSSETDESRGMSSLTEGPRIIREGVGDEMETVLRASAAWETVQASTRSIDDGGVRMGSLMGVAIVLEGEGNWTTRNTRSEGGRVSQGVSRKVYIYTETNDDGSMVQVALCERRGPGYDSCTCQTVSGQSDSSYKTCFQSCT